MMMMLRCCETSWILNLAKISEKLLDFDSSLWWAREGSAINHYQHLVDVVDFKRMPSPMHERKHCDNFVVLWKQKNKLDNLRKIAKKTSPAAPNLGMWAMKFFKLCGGNREVIYLLVWKCEMWKQISFSFRNSHSGIIYHANLPLRHEIMKIFSLSS